ncbi:hypothetical protein [Buchnera aphidicola]|uniref:hypothetical protein n=1 Tax=Buchnera aphidicola TaxID=9 RepID=UPI0031B85275
MNKIFFFFISFFLIFYYYFLIIVKENNYDICYFNNPFFLFPKRNIIILKPGLYFKKNIFLKYEKIYNKNINSNSDNYYILINNSLLSLNIYITWKINNISVFYKKNNNFNKLNFERYLQYEFFIKFRKIIKNFYIKEYFNYLDFFLKKKFKKDLEKINFLNKNKNIKYSFLYFINNFKKNNKNVFFLKDNIFSNLGIEIIDYGILNYKFSKLDLNSILNFLNMKNEKFYKINRLRGL